MDNEVTRLDDRVEESNDVLKKGFAEFKENNTKPMLDMMDEKMREVSKMQESQNFVLKDLHDKRISMNNRLHELERTDFDDKFNHITRRMIADVLRELLTPVQMQ